MKRLAMVVLFLAFVSVSYAHAQDAWTRDIYGHPTKEKNMYKDRDGDGVVNAYDRNDRNRNVW